MGRETQKKKKIREFEEVMSKLPEEDREFFKKRGLGSYEGYQNNKASWKHAENLSPKEREFNYGALIRALKSNNPKERDIAIKWWEEIYRSFTHSKEWKSFRQNFLMLNPKCVKCRGHSETPHHKLSAYKSFIEKGFLEPLKDFSNFEALCVDCHVKIEGVV